MSGFEARPNLTKLLQYLVLIVGLLSPLLARWFYALTYTTLTRASTNRDKDWLFRLAVSGLAMALPFFATVFLAWLAGRQQRTAEATSRSEKRRQQRSTAAASASTPWIVRIGLMVAALSLLLLWKPIGDGTSRWKQQGNLAKSGVPAPDFSTLDIDGNRQRLADHKGQVVVVNIWATWCAPCRAEMPALDRLYQQEKDRGLMVFGISNEDADLQGQFRQIVPVSYPLLTMGGEVPSLYRDIARYPATFLIDRQGRLQPAPSPDKPFEELQAAVERLLNAGP